MLVFLDRKLAFLAVPKTGTTALELALRGRADIVLRRRLKHMPAQRFHRKMAPFLEDTYGVRPDRLAVMRDPLDQMRSWYRYRRAERLEGSQKATSDISFDDFALATIERRPPAYAAIGSQFKFLTSARGDVLVTHLFAYPAQERLMAFLATRFGEEIEVERRNVSEPAETPLSAETEAKVRAARAQDFELYDRLVAAGGYLHTEIS